MNWREKGMKEGNFSDKCDEVVKMGKCIHDYGKDGE